MNDSALVDIPFDRLCLWTKIPVPILSSLAEASPFIRLDPLRRTVMA